MLTFRTACHLLMSDEAVFAALPVFFFLAPSSPAPTGARSAGRFLSSLALSCGQHQSLDAAWRQGKEFWWSTLR